MRCKPGDLAMYVGKDQAVCGQIVKCIRLLTKKECDEEQIKGLALPAWRISPQLRKSNGVMANNASDKALRPIRDNDGEDEMIRIAGKPQKETA